MLKNKNIAGWNEHIKEFADESIFWHSIWKSYNKPLEGYIYDMMKSSKYTYKQAVRRLKRCDDKIKNDNFIQSILKNKNS